MSKTQFQSVIDYLRLENSTVHKEHLTAIRDLYRQVLQLSEDASMPDDPNEEVVTTVAHRLNLRIDDNDAREYLLDCVRSNDINDAGLLISYKLVGDVKPLNFELCATTNPPLLLPTRPQPSFARDSPDVTQKPSVTGQYTTSVTDIDCRLTVKMNAVEIDQFIRSFLLQDVKMLSREQIISNPSSICVRYNEQFCLDPSCLLQLFIRKQLRDCGVDSSNDLRASARLHLVQPFTITDDFGTLPYDHLGGLFDLELLPHNGNERFPARWCLAGNARIHCLICNQDSTKETSSSAHNDQPHTWTLCTFVNDVCAREAEGRAKSWLDALDKEEIFTYEQLANLQENDWHSINKLTMHAKKLLKAAINRKRESVPNDRRQHGSNDSDQENHDRIRSDTDKALYSRSELLAKLHLIKLFIFYTLRIERNLRGCNALPRLEAECLRKTFEEMKEEGFADDGLFLKMEKFFLPLTISEQELYIDRELDKVKRQKLQAEQEEITIKIEKIRCEYNEHNRILWTYDDHITDLTNLLKQAQNHYSQERSTLAARSNDESQQKRAQTLHKLDQQWSQEQTNLGRRIFEKKKLKSDLEKVIGSLEKELDENEMRKENIHIELSDSPKYVDKQLIKPARGLIMYGPPGTGKSEIMSNLAVKLGIVMVGPPLAAGELNRPLVGESERIIIHLCQRCNRIPYAMCCISIDEIDSLAPKRDEDSSEGKVDKISVLLSLIEGIKDVPNLMILCATNRLHMMDEAFLRRMSGKYFVGRPSSTARTTILKTIPDSVLKPEVLDRLVVVTTNFSGAAVRALTRALTVECIAARRTESKYQIDRNTALQIADRTAQQYQVFFGSETLPRLHLRSLSDGSHLSTHQLSNNASYTGRIVVDLHRGEVRIETRTQRGDSTNDGLSIIVDKLHCGETNVQSLLERLTIYGKNRNVQLLQLVDLNLLASQSAHDEKKVFETLKDRYDECIGYAHSMIIYDLDALVGVNRSESVSNMGLSTSSSVVNQKIYTYVRARFRDNVMEDERINSADRHERWVVAIISEPFLLRQFCTDVQFTRTSQEKDELELERRNREEHIKCVKCKDFYIENENKMGNCVHHDGFIYDNSAADLTIYKPTEAIQLLNKIECIAIIDADQRDESERQKNKFKWICCDAILASGNTSGCKKGKHGFNGNNLDQLQDQRHANNTTNRLTPEIIRQWEEACCANAEYTEKWIILLDERIQ